MQHAIVTESIIKRTIYDWKFNNVMVTLVKSLFWALFEFCVPMSPIYVPLPVYNYPYILSFTKNDGNNNLCPCFQQCDPRLRGVQPQRGGGRGGARAEAAQRGRAGGQSAAERALGDWVGNP